MNGRVLCWGFNVYGRIGNGTEQFVERPILLAGLEEVVVVACGAGHTLAATRSGELFAWGKNYLGALGVGDTEDRHVPTKVAALGAAVVCCDGGDNYSAAVTTDGRLFTTGCGFFHANALPDERPQLNWTEVSALAGIRVVGVACGALHGLCLDDHGRVFGWGNNEHGQVGIGAPSKSVVAPTRIPLLPTELRVTKVVAKKSFSLAIAETGDCFVWGDEPVGFGQAAPMKLEMLKHVIDADVCVAHAVVCCEDGSVFSWGSSPKTNNGKPLIAGHLGQGLAVETIREPTRVPGAPQTISVGAGWCHTLMLDRTGRLWVLGDTMTVEDRLVDPKPSPVLQPGLEGQQIAAFATSVHHIICTTHM